MVERGPYVSYANCGLPYHIGGVIEREASLLVASERAFSTSSSPSTHDARLLDLWIVGGADAWTSASKTLKRLGITDYEKVYLYPNSHAGYYPGAKMVGFKLLYRKSDGKVLGGQALSHDGPGADKRISALAVAIQMGATIDDLAEAEICYAPQFGSAKDPIELCRNGGARH